MNAPVVFNPVDAVAAELPHPEAFVGYARVSTKRQAREGDSIEVQTAEMAAYAHELGATLHGPHVDHSSGYKRSSLRRPGLNAAIDEAVRLQVPLLVADIDRLSRSLLDLSLLDRDFLVIFSADRGRIERAVLKAAIAKAQAESEAKSRRVKDQHANRAATGSSVSPAFSAGRRLGSERNTSRSKERDQEVAEFLHKNPEVNNLTRRELVELLNSSGPQNLKGADGYREPWTYESFRPVHKRAVKILAEGSGSQLSQGVDGAQASPFCKGAVGQSSVSDVDLYLAALKADCSQPRPLTMDERAALKLVIKMDLTVHKKLKASEIKVLMEVLKAEQKTFPVKALKTLQTLYRRYIYLCGPSEK